MGDQGCWVQVWMWVQGLEHVGAFDCGSSGHCS